MIKKKKHTYQFMLYCHADLKNGGTRSYNMGPYYIESVNIPTTAKCLEVVKNEKVNPDTEENTGLYKLLITRDGGDVFIHVEKGYKYLITVSNIQKIK